MKFLFPCPGCRQRLAVPNHAGHDATLRCPVCHHEISAQFWLADSFDEPIAWEVVEHTDPGNELSRAEQASEEFLDFSSVSEDGVSFDRYDPTSQTSSYSSDEPTDLNRRSEAADGSLAESLDCHLPSSQAEQCDGLGAIALVASGEPDTFRRDEPAEAVTEEAFDAIAEPDLEVALLDVEGEDPSIESQTTPLIDEAVSEFFTPIEEAKPEPTNQENVETAMPFAEAMASTKRSVSPQLLPDGVGFGRSRRKKKKSTVGFLLSVIGGGAAAVPISLAILWYGFGTDPLEFGPVVASVAPWLVPVDLRGASYLERKRLPKVDGLPDQSTFQSGLPPLANDARNAQEASSADLSSAGLPHANIRLQAPSESNEAVEAPDTERVLDPSIFQVDRPAASENGGRVNASSRNQADDTLGGLSLASNAKPAATNEQPGSAATTASDDERRSPVVKSPLQIRENQTHDDAIRAALSQLELSFSGMEAESEASAKLVVNALEHFGKLMATIPVTDPRYSIWQNQASPILQAMLEDPKIKLCFVEDFQRSSQKTPQVGWVGSDLIKFDHANQELTGIEWVASSRQGTLAAARKLVAAPTLDCTPEPNSFYWVIGINEMQAEEKELVFRILLAIRFTPRNGK